MTPALIVFGFSLKARPIAAFTSRSVSVLFFLSKSMTKPRIFATFLSMGETSPMSNFVMVMDTNQM